MMYATDTAFAFRDAEKEQEDNYVSKYGMIC